MKPSIRLKQKGWQNLFCAKKNIGITKILKIFFLNAYKTILVQLHKSETLRKFMFVEYLKPTG